MVTLSNDPIPFTNPVNVKRESSDWPKTAPLIVDGISASLGVTITPAPVTLPPIATIIPVSDTNSPAVKGLAVTLPSEEIAPKHRFIFIEQLIAVATDL